MLQVDKHQRENKRWLNGKLICLWEYLWIGFIMKIRKVKDEQWSLNYVIHHIKWHHPILIGSKDTNCMDSSIETLTCSMSTFKPDVDNGNDDDEDENDWMHLFAFSCQQTWRTLVQHSYCLSTLNGQSIVKHCEVQIQPNCQTWHWNLLAFHIIYEKKMLPSNVCMYSMWWIANRIVQHKCNWLSTPTHTNRIRFDSTPY